MAIDILVWKNKPVVETFTERKNIAFTYSN